MARATDDQLDLVLSTGFTRELLVDVLHGTDRVAQGVRPSQWSISGNLGRDPKATGSLTFVHESVNGESWVPQGTLGVLSPFRATLLLTEVIRAGAFERRVQLGMFDVVAVPRAMDVLGHANARWVEVFSESGDVFEEDFSEEFPGILLYQGGWMTGGKQTVLGSVVEVDIESLDSRVLRASLRSPRTALGSAIDEWRAVGILPLVAPGSDAPLSPTTWVCEQGSRLDAVQTCARVLGGTPVVDSFGQWVLAGSDSVTLTIGETGTVVDLSSSLTLDGFFNVVVGDYETEDGKPIRSVWVAPGRFSPDAMGREFVRYHSSDLVRTQAAADTATASIGALSTSQDVDVAVTCVYNPILELGDRVEVVEANAVLVTGVCQGIEASDAETMRVTIRERRPL